MFHNRYVNATLVLLCNIISKVGEHEETKVNNTHIPHVSTFNQILLSILKMK